MRRRLFDVVIAALGLAGASPVLVGVAVAIRMLDGPPVLHRSVRCGRGGVPFTLYKFRTMVVGAAAAGPGITSGGDRRVTRLRRLLRGTKLDELPQLWNVVRGDMSLVGPRPEDPRYVDDYTA